MAMRTVVDVVNCKQVLTSLVDVTEALHALGFTIDELHRAVDAGEVDRDSCTANNPSNDGASRAHGTTVRVLREIKIPHEFVACEDRCFNTLVAPDESFEIAVATGDEATGNPDRTPRTRNRRGELAIVGIERNRRQLFLPNITIVRSKTKNKSRTAACCWILLRHRHDDVVRVELSLPLGLGDDDRVNEWGTRIILPDLTIGPRGGQVLPRDGEGDDDAIDIAVVRKSA